jgi:N utilization substance protein A
MLLDLKALKAALDELEEERRIPKQKIIEAIEFALAAAYKKEYGKRDQIIRATFNTDTGATEFYQVKIVVDDSTVRIVAEDTEDVHEEGDERVRFNPEKHIMQVDAQKIKADAELDEELIFPLENQEDFGRIAAQTAKQVVIQRIREAERSSILDEFGTKEGEVISGVVQKIDRGTVYIDFHRTVGMISPEEQIPGEEYRRGERVRAYLYSVEETARGVMLRLSRTHPKFIETLFGFESPEVASGIVIIKSIAREPGSRSKIAVYSTDEHIDPVGSCVGGRGVRVGAVMGELAGEKIDIIPWSEDTKEFVANSLSPAEVISIEIDEREHKASVEVNADQLSLAIGKGGQNVRLAAKLTGWRIDIKGVKGEEFASSDGETVETSEPIEETLPETTLTDELAAEIAETKPETPENEPKE